MMPLTDRWPSSCFSLQNQLLKRRHQGYLLGTIAVWTIILFLRSLVNHDIGTSSHVATSRNLPIEKAPLESGNIQPGFDDLLDDQDTSPPAATIGPVINVPTDSLDYHEIFSLTTTHRRFAPIYFEGIGVVDPSIVPHPTHVNAYIITARREQSLSDHVREEQLVCHANFYQDVLVCADKHTTMPTAVSRYGTCPLRHDDFNYRFGPMDLRLFYGPEVPYVVFSDTSQYTCRNVWLQDARHLLEAFRIERVIGSQLFHAATELQRPGAWTDFERDYFLFWDRNNKPYVQSSFWPRVFGSLEADGSFAHDLAPSTASADSFCQAQYMPHIQGEHESFRQGSNSLSITLCKRADASCSPKDSNTFIMYIFHTRKDYDDHPIHEPYVILYDQSPPFAIRAIGQRPLWIAGRKKLDSSSSAFRWAGKNSSEIPAGHTENFFITSMSWGTHGMKYHGYQDDVVWLSATIEDAGAGVIDVRASDLLAGLSFC